jgi:hypothetical protein
MKKQNHLTHAKTILGLLLLPLLGAPSMHAQSPAISIDCTNYSTQTDATTVTPQLQPYSLAIQIRGGLTAMSAWGPAFYKPGSGGVPQTGSNSDTNTGTLNFPATPNNGTDFMFMHDFASSAALHSFYPEGTYGIKFAGSDGLGTGAPSPATFTAGLTFSGGGYPSVTPQITSASNGATWSEGVLHLQPTGITTLSFNTFPEYSSTTYGSMIAVGIYATNTGNVIDPASKESYYLPVGDSPGAPSTHQPAITQVTVDGSWFTPGVNYTLELQYMVIGGQPDEANLNGIEFQGVATYRRLVTVQVSVGSSAGVVGADFNGDGKTDLLWRQPSTGRVVLSLMNGTTEISDVDLATDPDWLVAGTGDFNSDGQTDILWRQTSTGRIIVWMMNGTTRASYTDIVTDLDWTVGGTGDFNSDGKSDILLRQSSTGRVIVWLMNGTTRASYADIATDANWQVVNH